MSYSIGNEQQLQQAMTEIAKQVDWGTPNDYMARHIEACCQFIHYRNFLAGWWTDIQRGKPLKRNVGELLMLAVSEVAEVPARPNTLTQPDDKLPHRKMIEVEIADCLIRLFDTSAGLDWESFRHVGPDGAEYDPRRPQEEALMRVVRHLALAMEAHRKGLTYMPDDRVRPSAEIHIGHAIWCLLWIGKRWGLDLPGAVAEKVAFNAKREDHKREARSLPGGKAY